MLLYVIWISFTLTGRSQTKDSIPDFERFYKNGLAFLDSGRYKEAGEMFSKTIKKKPDHWEAFNKLAFIALERDDLKSADKHLIKAEKTAPMNTEGLNLRVRWFIKQNKFKEALVVADTLIYLNEQDMVDDPEPYLYKARALFQLKNYKGALHACESATDIKPRNIAAKVLQGETRFAMKDYNYAIKELNEAIGWMDTETTDYNAFKIRAKSKFEVADYKGAVKDWNVYIDAIPGEEEALVSRAAAKININDNTGAIADLDEAIKKNPKNPVSWCYRGVAKGGNKVYTEAMKDLDQSIKLKFNYHTAYVNRAAIKLALKDKRGACDDLQKADSLGSETAYKLIEKYCK